LGGGGPHDKLRHQPLLDVDYVKNTEMNELP